MGTHFPEIFAVTSFHYNWQCWLHHIIFTNWAVDGLVPSMTWQSAANWGFLVNVHFNTWWNSHWLSFYKTEQSFMINIFILINIFASDKVQKIFMPEEIVFLRNHAGRHFPIMSTCNLIVFCAKGKWRRFRASLFDHTVSGQFIVSQPMFNMLLFCHYKQ